MFNVISENKNIFSIIKEKDKEIYVDIGQLSIDKSAVMLLPKYFRSKYKLLPISVNINLNTITIVTASKLNNFQKEYIKFICGYEPIIFYSNNSNDLEKYIEKFKEYDIKALKKCNYNLKQEDKTSSPTIELVNTIFKEAINLKASDIHIEPFKDFYKVRFRIDGVLREFTRLPKLSYNSVVSRVKVLSKIDISEKRIPLDGRLSFENNNILWDFRASTMPTISGEKIVIRIFRNEERKNTINEIGLINENLNVVQKMLNLKSGIILVSGPTGSGKSTTLYTLLKCMDLEGKNIVTIEDPVEQSIDDVVQINVNQSIGFDFASGLRSILRQDPDIIMVGEIRDKETATIAMRAAITGHMVFSTIHTYNCASVIDRLFDMGIEPYMISAGILGIISQRLIRKICNNCRKEYTPNDFEKHFLGITEKTKLSYGHGCEKCGYTGYYGRTGVFEVIEIKDYHKKSILSNKGQNYFEEISISNGMITLEKSSIDLVKGGVTTMKEVISLCNSTM